MKQEKKEKTLYPFRLDDDQISLLDKLQAHFDRPSRQNTIEYLIKYAAKKEGIK